MTILSRKFFINSAAATVALAGASALSFDTVKDNDGNLQISGVGLFTDAYARAGGGGRGGDTGGTGGGTSNSGTGGGPSSGHGNNSDPGTGAVGGGADAPGLGGDNGGATGSPSGPTGRSGGRSPDGNCCSGDSPDAPDSGGQDGGERNVCTATIEAKGFVNVGGRQYYAYRFADGSGNSRQNGADGVTLSSKDYKIGHTIRFDQPWSFFGRFDTVWADTLRDPAGCRRGGGEILGDYQGYISQGVPFTSNGHSWSGSSSSGSSSARTTRSSGNGNNTVRVAVPAAPVIRDDLAQVIGACTAAQSVNDELRAEFAGKLNFPKWYVAAADTSYANDEAVMGCEKVAVSVRDEKCASDSQTFAMDDLNGMKAYVRGRLEGQCHVAMEFQSKASETTAPVVAATATAVPQVTSVVNGSCVTVTVTHNGQTTQTKQCLPTATAAANVCTSETTKGLTLNGN